MKKIIKDFLKLVWITSKNVYKCDKKSMCLLAFTKILNGILLPLQIVVIANFIDKVGRIKSSNFSTSIIFSDILLLGILIIYQWLGKQLIILVRQRLENNIRLGVSMELLEECNLLSYENFEGEKQRNIIERVTVESEKKILNQYMHILEAVELGTRVIGIGVILYRQIWWLPFVFFLAAIPCMIIAVKGGQKSYKAGKEVTESKRKNQYYMDTLIDRKFVNERTLFSYTETISDKYEKKFESIRKHVIRAKRKWFLLAKLSSMLTIGLSVIIIFLMMPLLEMKKVSLGMFIAVINGVLSLIQSISWSVIHLLHQIAGDIEYMKDIELFYAFKKIDDKSGIDGDEFKKIEFKNVRFKYPNTDEYVIDGMSFIINRNEQCYIVGKNGAGKSTVVKLISGLYTDYEGVILLNDKDIKSYSLWYRWKLLAIVFQDFAQYPMSILENITFTESLENVNEKNSTNQIENILNSLNMTEFIEKLPKGIMTKLGKVNRQSSDLSGGQWQRLSIARAMYHGGEIMILDEPTAAMDPIVETKMYEEFEEISSEKTSIFITHRLASVRNANKIIVIENGRVEEIGSHDVLINKNGIYKEMYDSQAKWYKV
jgi:ABC-type multidrug transport system, ATPase and permease components